VPVVMMFHGGRRHGESGHEGNRMDRKSG
jgi:hypothetical protein